VLHRPVELAALTGEVGSSTSNLRLREVGSSIAFPSCTRKVKHLPAAFAFDRVQSLIGCGVRLNHRSIQIFTDGSAKENPGGKGGIVVVVRYPDHLQLPDEVICELGFTESTSNRMELLACIKALEWVRRNKPWRDVTSVQIVTDSKYVADNVGYRAWGWKKNKWRNQHGEPKENSDLWKKLLSARQKAGINIGFVQTKGKKSEILRKVDKTAKDARDGGMEIDRGYEPGTVSRSMVKGAAKRFPAIGQASWRRNSQTSFEISSQPNRINLPKRPAVLRNCAK
jgi:ribonuclease HI